MTSPSQPTPRCEICDWPLADSQEKGCIPGDCSYRPDDPAEQQRIRRRREALSTSPSQLTSPSVDARSSADETWAYIERLLHDECGLMLDCGLEGQRANCINAIKNGLPDPALLRAAVEFLSRGEGLHKVRVNGKMMDRKEVATALKTNEDFEREYRNQVDNGNLNTAFALSVPRVEPTSPSVDALIRDLEGFHDCADGDVTAGNGHFRLECISDSDQQRLNLRAVLREAAQALRALSAPRVEPVAWQRRLKNGDGPWTDWKECTEAQARFVQVHGHPSAFPKLSAEVRPLYASPPSQPALPMAADIAQIMQREHRSGHGWFEIAEIMLREFPDAPSQPDTDTKCDSSNASSIPAAMSSAQPTKIRSDNSSTARVTKLPENVRIPLHSLQADLEYLIGRVIADGSCGPMIVRSMRERLDQIETAISAPRVEPDTSPSVDAETLIARADKYLNTGSGEYASEIMRDMAEFIRRLPALLAPRIEPVADEIKKAEIERLRGGENWCRYASHEILRQAVIELRRSGDISGITTEKAKKLFPEIKSGWEDDIPAGSPEGNEIEELRSALRQLVDECVNPGDGGSYEAGEWPALDRARLALGPKP